MTPAIFIIFWVGGFKRGDGQSVNGHNKPTAIFSTCAGAGIYRRSILAEIGLFDEAFFAYGGYRYVIPGFDKRLSRIAMNRKPSATILAAQRPLKDKSTVPLKCRFRPGTIFMWPIKICHLFS